MSGCFVGQVAIITGGAQGLGKAIAENLVTHGASVLLFDVDKEKGESVCQSLQKGGGTAKFIQVNVADEKSVEEGFRYFREQFDHLDIMVNCAGIVGPTNVVVEDIPTQDFDHVYSVNVRGSFLMTKYSIIEMKKQNYGRILLIASIAGKEGNARMAAYSCSKAAVIGFVKSVGKEYAETGITVNALAPAVVRTAMVDGLAPDIVKYMTDKIPMKRCCTLEEVSAIVKFIVSREASFNTGVTFDLTGGRAVY